MALAHSPRIVTDGLVCYLDAANTKSYPGGGTTWFDLTKNNHNFSIGSNASHNTSDAGGVFDLPEQAGANLENNTVNLSETNHTVIGFTRKLTSGNNGRILTARNNNWLLGHHDTTYGDYYADGWIYSGLGTVDTSWRMFTGTGNIGSDNWQVFINDELITENSGGSGGPNGFNINGYASQYSDAQTSIVICYDRVLTPAEIRQNFNAIRGRYGI